MLWLFWFLINSLAFRTVEILWNLLEFGSKQEVRIHYFNGKSNVYLCKVREARNSSHKHRITGYMWALGDWIKNKYTYIFVLCKCIMVIHFLKHLVLFSVRLLINWTVKSVSGLLLKYQVSHTLGFYPQTQKLEPPCTA